MESTGKEGWDIMADRTEAQKIQQGYAWALARLTGVVHAKSLIWSYELDKANWEEAHELCQQIQIAAGKLITLLKSDYSRQHKGEQE